MPVSGSAQALCTSSTSGAEGGLTFAVRLGAAAGGHQLVALCEDVRMHGERELVLFRSAASTGRQGERADQREITCGSEEI